MVERNDDRAVRWALRQPAKHFKIKLQLAVRIVNLRVKPAFGGRMCR
jgi:hypothetical protein